MRPVNLIPPDERRGDGAPLRMGSLIYVLTGGLALLLIGIVAVTLTGKQVSDREAEKASLEQELVQAQAQAASVQPFADFRAVQESRAATASSLAQSRFDWPRVLNELALVLPSDIQLDTLTGTVNPSVQLAASGQVDTRSEVEGPALEIVGCAPNQDSVAGFVGTLEDIDGVTRVGVKSSKLPDDAETAVVTSGGAVASGAGGGTDDCQVTPDIFKFEIVVAFDAVPTPSTATSAPSVPAPVAPSTGGGQQQVANTQAQQAGG